MKVYEIKNSEAQVFAFEVDNGMLRRSAVVKVLENLPDVKIYKFPKKFSLSREEMFCEFESSGNVFQVLEPFGDNSRYWIGPKDNAWHPEIDIIKNAFISL